MRKRSPEQLQADLDQRNAEIALLNTIQTGLASQLDMQAIYDLVGEEIRQLFKADTTYIARFDERASLLEFPYYVEQGHRHPQPPSAYGPGLTSLVIKTRRPKLFGTTADWRAASPDVIEVASPEAQEDLNESYLGVPVRAGKKVTGVLSVQSHQRNAYDRADARLLTTIAGGIGLALENARLLEETRQRNAELAIINSVQQGLAAQLDIQAIYDLVGDKIREIFEAAVVYIALRNPAQHNQILFPYYVDRGKRQSPTPIVRGEGITSVVMDKRAPVLAGTYQEQLDLGGIFDDDQSQSYLGVPIMAGDEAVGVISVQSYTQNAYGEADVRLLGTLASSMSVALENAFLFDETTRLLEETRQRNAELAIINSVQMALAAKLDFQGVIDAVGDEILGIFPGESVGIGLVDREHDLIHFLYSFENGKRYPNHEFPLGQGLSSIVISTREPLVLNFDTARRSTELGAVRPAAPGDPQSWLGIPIIVAEDVLGVIILEDWHRENAYPEPRVRLVQTLASSLGVALENARLFDETQRLFKAEQQRAAELAIINGVQNGLASKLDMQAIIDLVGDKINEIFNTHVVSIALYDRETETITYPYVIERGTRQKIEARPPHGFRLQIIKTHKPVVVNEDMHRVGLQAGNPVLSGEEPKSGIFVPMIIGDQVMGVISLQNLEHENAFPASDVNLLMTLSSSLSVALENARLFDETQRLFKAEQQRAAELQIINSVQEGLASKLDMRAIYELVGEKVREIFDAQVIDISTFDPASKMIQEQYVFEKGDRTLAPGYPLGGYRKHIHKTRQPLVINRDMSQAAKKYGQKRIVGAMPKAWLGVPLLAGGVVTGFITLQNLDREEVFSDSDVRLLSTLANSMSVALENARLFDETQRLFKAEQQRAAELQIINSVQEGLASKLDMQSIYDLVGDKVREIFAAEVTEILLLDPETNMIHIPYSYYRARVQPEPFPLGGGLTSQIIQTRKPLAHGSLQEATQLGAIVISDEDKTESYMGVPLMVGNKAMGVLSIQSYQPNAFSDSDLRLLATFANSMSVALENARLFDETQRLLKAERQRATELEIINSVQAGLVGSMDMAAIYELVGDKISGLFDAQAVTISSYDLDKKLNHYHYIVEKGERVYTDPLPFGPIAEHMIKTRQPFITHDDYAEQLKALGGEVVIIGATETPKSAVFVPLIVGKQAKGAVSLQHMERSNAFSEGDIRVLTTLANSMSVALENARLFEQTQQLNAELAIIISIQRGLASKLDFQGIIDLVGDELRRVFHTGDIGIRTFDQEANRVNYLYEFEHGHRLTIPSQEPRGLSKHIIETAKPLVINYDMAQQLAGLGGLILPGTDTGKAFMGVPIMSGKKITGLIVIENHERENAFTDSDLRLLTTLANSMSVALDNAQLFEETERRNAELAILNRVQHGLAAQLDTQTIIDTVGQELGQVFNADTAVVAIYDRATGLIRSDYYVERGQRLSVEPTKLGEGLNSYVIKSRKALVLGTATETDHYGAISVPNPSLQEQDLNESYLGVPIRIGDTVSGVINVQSYQQNAFTQDHVRLLTTIAYSTGVALENARLFDETQRLLKETEERNAELAIINSVQAALAAKLDMQGIYDAVGDKIREIFKADTTFIGFHDEHNNLVVAPYYVDKGMRPGITSRPYGKGLLEAIVESGKPLLLNTTSELAQAGNYPIASPGSDKDLNESFLGVPIFRNGKAIGATSVQSYQQYAYDQNDLRLLTTLTNSMSVALENARLFDETQRLLKETEQRAVELQIINSVQEGLASKLDIQAIYDLVGDKIRDIFDAQVVVIVSFDHNTRIAHFPYIFEKGMRFNSVPQPFNVLAEHLIATQQSILINQDAILHTQELGLATTPGTEMPKSLLFVPLVASGEVKGYISLQSIDRENAFTESDVRLLSTLASSMSVALENARLFDETTRLLHQTEQRAAELATVNTVSQALATEIELDALIELTGEQMRQIFDADIVYVALHNRQTDMIEFRYSYGQELAAIRFGEGLTSRILETAKPLLINQDIDATSAALKTPRVGRDAKSYLGIPIMAGKQAIGVISVQSTEAEGRFDESDVRLLSTIAANVGAAIRNAQLYEEVQNRVTEMTTLAEIGSDIAATHELEPVLGKIAARVKDMMRVQDIALYLRDSDNETFRPVVALGDYVAEVMNDTFKPGQGITGYVAQTGVAEFANEPTRHPNARTIAGTPAEEEEPEGLMSAPLIANNEVIGLITVWRKHRFGLFSQPELDFLVSVARQAAIAIESARLYLQTERRASEMSALAEVGREVSSTLDLETVLERIAARARELLAADHSAVYLSESDARTLRATVAVGSIAEEIKAKPIMVGDGMIGDMALRRSAEIVNDMANDPRAIPISGTEVEADEKLMAAPLMSGERLTGMMAVWRRADSRYFADSDLSFLTGMARQASIAIENARLFEEAEEARAAAENANRAKSTFLANMSHELRTPLNAIIGFTRIVRRRGEGVLPDKQLENLDKVLTSAEHLLNLINTVLDIAKIEAGRMDVQPANFEVAGLVDGCVTTAQPLVRPGVVIVKQVEAGLAPLYSDQDKVRQVLLNLISNAAKFTHEGAITVNATRQAGHLEIAVTDTGIGISGEALERVFEEFQQADSSTTREYGGTGLGLSISRGLAHLLGGDLTASSVEGQGSTFTLTLPLRYGERSSDPKLPRPEAQAVPVRLPSGERPVILTIDDDPDTIYLLQESLSEAGYQVVAATSGEEGIRTARELHPLAITLDVMMPRKDGWQVLNELKSHPETADIPIVMVTIVDNKALGFQLGAADYLLKPLDGDSVRAALDRLVQVNGGVAPRSLLVVDDDPHVTDMVRQLLEDSSFEVLSAADGREALAAIKQHKPDALLLDLMMPRLDGFGVIERLRTMPAYRHIPIVVLTAKSLTTEEASALQQSAIRVIQKQGLEAERLIKELQRALAGAGGLSKQARRRKS